MRTNHCGCPAYYESGNVDAITQLAEDIANERIKERAQNATLDMSDYQLGRLYTQLKSTAEKAAEKTSKKPLKQA